MWPILILLTRYVKELLSPRNTSFFTKYLSIGQAPAQNPWVGTAIASFKLSIVLVSTTKTARLSRMMPRVMALVWTIVGGDVDFSTNGKISLKRARYQSVALALFWMGSAAIGTALVVMPTASPASRSGKRIINALQADSG